MAAHNSKFTSASCPRCMTTFDRLPIDGDGIDTYAVMPGTFSACCGEFLCACCAQVACDGCGQAICAECVLTVEDGTEAPLKCCAACALECEPLEALPAMAACACAYCEAPITMEDSQYTCGGITAHTRCANEVEAERAAWIAECDDTEGAAYFGDRLPRKLAAVATSATGEQSESEVA